MLRERPGLQSITYFAKFDYQGFQKIVPSMCESALQWKDSNVNIVLDFMLNLTTLTPLYIGHKPTGLMIDNRTKKQFENIKANKHQNTFKLDVF